ncbi:hypothetical protein NBRC111893_591 [Lentilactobacillus kosonis]|uniref:Uncharacterized protein n=1 Tax=Lentilactobacillus kosonis TaxID=2810561 RepID=A0A401FJ84_9LACO|nr:hypothetical protein NBRC111893_591 [Lentilactobacillus kosonis]
MGSPMIDLANIPKLNAIMNLIVKKNRQPSSTFNIFSSPL